MRKILLMFAFTLCVIGAQLAFAQTQSATTPSASDNASSGPQSEYGQSDMQTPNAMADPAVTVPATGLSANEQGSTISGKGTGTEDPQYDPAKSPYWEPKDWSYISTTTP